MQHYVKGQLYKAKSGAVFMLWNRKDNRGKMLYGAQWLFNGVWILDEFTVSYNRKLKNAMLHDRLGDDRPVDSVLWKEERDYE